MRTDHKSWGWTRLCSLRTLTRKVWTRLRCVIRPQEFYGDGFPHLLYYLGENGSADLIRVHPERNQHFEMSGGQYGSPLAAGLFAGHSAAARAFVNLSPLPKQELMEATQAKPRRNLALKKDSFSKTCSMLTFLCEFGDTDILRTVLESKRLK